MDCENCPHDDKPRVTLMDGTECCSWCPRWLHECEARAVANMPTLAQRRRYMYGETDFRGRTTGGIKKRRGAAALAKLEATVKEIWARRVAESKQELRDFMHENQQQQKGKSNAA